MFNVSANPSWILFPYLASQLVWILKIFGSNQVLDSNFDGFWLLSIFRDEIRVASVGVLVYGALPWISIKSLRFLLKLYGSNIVSLYKRPEFNLYLLRWGLICLISSLNSVVILTKLSRLSCVWIHLCSLASAMISCVASVLTVLMIAIK